MVIIGSLNFTLYQEPQLGRYLPVRVTGVTRTGFRGTQASIAGVWAQTATRPQRQGRHRVSRPAAARRKRLGQGQGHLPRAGRGAAALVDVERPAEVSAGSVDAACGRKPVFAAAMERVDFLAGPAQSVVRFHLRSEPLAVFRHRRLPRRYRRAGAALAAPAHDAAHARGSRAAAGFCSPPPPVISSSAAAAGRRKAFCWRRRSWKTPATVTSKHRATSRYFRRSAASIVSLSGEAGWMRCRSAAPASTQAAAQSLVYRHGGGVTRVQLPLEDWGFRLLRGRHVERLQLTAAIERAGRRVIAQGPQPERQGPDRLLAGGARDAHCAGRSAQRRELDENIFAERRRGRSQGGAPTRACARSSSTTSRAMFCFTLRFFRRIARKAPGAAARRSFSAG